MECLGVAREFFDISFEAIPEGISEGYYVDSWLKCILCDEPLEGLC